MSFQHGFTEAWIDETTGIPKHKHSPGPEDNGHWASAVGHRGDNGTMHSQACAERPWKWRGNPSSEEKQLYQDALAERIKWRIPTKAEKAASGRTLRDYERGDYDFPVKNGSPEIVERWKVILRNLRRSNSSGGNTKPASPSTLATGPEMLASKPVGYVEPQAQGTTLKLNAGDGTSKTHRLFALAQKRQVTKYAGYNGIGDYHNGAFECDHVSPYTLSAHNVDSDILIMLQDWSSDETLMQPLRPRLIPYGHDPALPTNRRLVELMKAHFKTELKDVYATNLFPFVKLGGISTSIPVTDLVRAAREFALPQIQIVQPKLVVCLGLNTFNALALACGGPTSNPMDSAIGSPFTFEGIRIWCQAHTGARGQNNRGHEKVEHDWRRMHAEFANLS